MFPYIKIYRQSIVVCDDDVMRVQSVRKWCRGFESGRTDMRDADRTSWHSTSGTDVNAIECRNWFWKTGESQFRDLSGAWEFFIELYKNCT